MKFIEVIDKLCGDEGICPNATSCVRPDEYDGPLFCMHKSLLLHDFKHPIIHHLPANYTVLTSPPTIDSPASAAGAHDIVVMFLLLCILLVLVLIAFFLGKTYRRNFRPIHFSTQRRPGPIIRTPGAQAAQADSPSTSTPNTESVA